MNRNYTLYKNSDNRIDDVDWQIDGVQQVLSDVEMGVRNPDTDAEIVYMSLTNGRATIAGASVTASITIPEEAWASVTFTGVADYDIKVTRASDSETHIAQVGDAVIRAGSTR